VSTKKVTRFHWKARQDSVGDDQDQVSIDLIKDVQEISQPDGDQKKEDVNVHESHGSNVDSNLKVNSRMKMLLMWNWSRMKKMLHAIVSVMNAVKCARGCNLEQPKELNEINPEGLVAVVSKTVQNQRPPPFGSCKIH